MHINRCIILADFGEGEGEAKTRPPKVRCEKEGGEYVQVKKIK